MIRIPHEDYSELVAPENPTVILVCGSRDWTDHAFIHDVLTDYPSDTILVHGDNGDREGTRGADRVAHKQALSLFSSPPRPYPAQWVKYGKRGGPLRNRAMLDKEKPSVVLAFHDDIVKSKGTKDCIAAALERGIRVILFFHEDTTDHGVGQWMYRELT